MKKALLITLIFIATSALTTWARAQNVYKCSGNTYSQIPCPDGVKLPPTQPPNNAERKHADDATARDARMADRMEKARLKQEQLDLIANTPMPAKVTQATSERASRPAQPKGLVAQTPRTKKVRASKRQTTHH